MKKKFKISYKCGAHGNRWKKHSTASSMDLAISHIDNLRRTIIGLSGIKIEPTENREF